MNPRTLNPKAYAVEGGGKLITDLDHLPVCKLVKMKTANGLFSYDGKKAWVGKLYKYSPRSRREVEFCHQPSKTNHEAECVLVYDPRGYFAWMPCECLNFAGP